MFRFLLVVLEPEWSELWVNVSTGWKEQTQNHMGSKIRLFPSLQDSEDKKNKKKRKELKVVQSRYLQMFEKKEDVKDKGPECKLRRNQNSQSILFKYLCKVIRCNLICYFIWHIFVQTKTVDDKLIHDDKQMAT